MSNTMQRSEAHHGRTDAHPEFFGKFAVWAILFILLLVVGYLAVPRQARSNGSVSPTTKTVAPLSR